MEQYLSEQLTSGDILLYLWQNERTVVIGRNQNAMRECRSELLAQDGGFLARRSTGGGAVYHDLGNLCFTFAADPALYDLKRQMKVVQKACASFGIPAILSGRNDIVTKEGKKFSGNAFSATSLCHLQHGTLMVEVNQEMLQKYLTPSFPKMKAKGVSSVRSRVVNLKQLAPQITVPRLAQALRESFEEEYGPVRELSETSFDKERLERLYEKYASWDWRFGKTPTCSLECSGMLSWGEVQIALELEHMRIRACKVYSDCLDADLPGLLENILVGLRLDAASLEQAFARIRTGMEKVNHEQTDRLMEAVLWVRMRLTDGSGDCQGTRMIVY